MIMSHDPVEQSLSQPAYGLRDYAAAGLLEAANPRLGARDTLLAAAYPTSPILKNTYTLSDAANLLAAIPTGVAGNDDFPKYSRNFTPVAPATDELYGNVRSKNFTPVEGDGLGTAYSPTVVSPGAGEGFSPKHLAVVPGVIPIKAPASAEALKAINPAEFRNDATAGVVGTVRRFTLGQGSNTVRRPA
jgi:hypothetical protein